MHPKCIMAMIGRATHAECSSPINELLHLAGLVWLDAVHVPDDTSQGSGVARSIPIGPDGTSLLASYGSNVNVSCVQESYLHSSTST